MGLSGMSHRPCIVAQDYRNTRANLAMVDVTGSMCACYKYKGIQIDQYYL